MREVQSSRFYELMVISVPASTPEEITDNTSSVSGYIETAGGRLLRANTDSPWGRRRLAYPIRHKSEDVRDGIYALYHFEIDPSSIPEIEREMKLNENLMRHLLLQLSAEPVFPEPEEEEAAGEDSEESEASGTAETAESTEESKESEPTDDETEGEDDSEGDAQADESEQDASSGEDEDEEEDESSESTPDEESESEEE